MKLNAPKRFTFWASVVLFVVGMVAAFGLIPYVPSLAGVMPFLVTTSPVFDMAPVTINLYVVKLTVGLAFMPNLMSMLGIILAIVLYRRYVAYQRDRAADHEASHA